MYFDVLKLTKKAFELLDAAISRSVVYYRDVCLFRGRQHGPDTAGENLSGIVIDDDDLDFGTHVRMVGVMNCETAAATIDRSAKVRLKFPVRLT